MNIDYQRRRFLIQTATAAAALQLGGCGRGDARYQDINIQSRQPLAPNASALELIRYATLSANGHNTQPWFFDVLDNDIRILPDISRRTPVVDPDDHHLYASLGCAAENLSIAAKAWGISGEVAIKTGEQTNVIIDTTADTTASGRSAPPLFNAITQRQVTRAQYEGKPAPVDVLERLNKAANSYGVDAYMVTDNNQKEQILELVVDGNSQQMDNPAFVQELKDWVRFNASSAAETRDGLYAACSGNPESPTLIGSTLFNLFFTKDAENDKYRDHIRSSSGLMVFVANQDDPEGWINAGRAYERFALQATLDGLKNAFVNQAVEELDMRIRLQSLFNLGDRRPNFVVRFGYGDALPMSLRRAVADVVI